MYQELLNNIQTDIKRHIDETDTNLPYISHQISQISKILVTLKPKTRNPRSLNFIGSAWKWLAGSPDHDDFQILKAHTHKILKNNEKQIIINNALAKRVNEISNITNNLIEIAKINQIPKNELILDVKYKLDIIKEELLNIEYALLWAKNKIVNSFILSNTEIKIVKERFENNKIPFINLEEALEFSDIRIASNKSILLYIITIPTTGTDICKKILIKPIKYMKKAIKLPFENVLYCNDQIFGIKNYCNTYNELTICKKNEIINLNSDNCIQNLIKSNPSSCEEVNNQHIPSIEEINPGTILLNQFNGTILVENNNINLTGSFILQYHNTSIFIDGQEYYSKEIPIAKPLPAILYSSSSVKTYKELLTMEMLKELHINNTEQITEIEEQVKVHKIANYSLSSMLILIIIAIIVKVMIPTRKEIVIKSKTLDELSPKLPDLNQDEPTTSSPIPIFYLSSEDTRI